MARVLEERRLVGKEQQQEPISWVTVQRLDTPKMDPDLKQPAHIASSSVQISFKHPALGSRKQFQKGSTKLGKRPKVQAMGDESPQQFPLVHVQKALPKYNIPCEEASSKRFLQNFLRRGVRMQHSNGVLK